MVVPPEGCDAKLLDFHVRFMFSSAIFMFKKYMRDM